MRNKKVRGLRRKTKDMINRIEEETKEFPSDFQKITGNWKNINKKSSKLFTYFIRLIYVKVLEY
ncbi:hypothetical protein C8K15_111100 [Paenisporosarcina sp. OV554]|nr:hypothetical protein C8K15_111100 [Paenisporosarcina sp. OV554]